MHIYIYRYIRIYIDLCIYLCREREWLPFGENSISAMAINLGALDR